MDESGIMHDARIGGLVDERYRVLEAMASGSMGVVYKAERVPVGKLVAIKFLHAPFANDSEFLARFERETRVMSKLTHPNCVSVVDFGVWEGAPYLVMEYVSGTTLRALIDRGPLPVKRALSLVRQIAAGLAHAHAQGVVHRDVKPANIMISEEIGTGDHARILDFGLARLRGAVGRDATQTNIVVGTPNYMAPEQTVGGGLIDARTDIYAVGVVLFEMVCGERPFQADDTLALLGMHRAAPIPRLADRVGEDVRLPLGLQEIVEKAMAKSPGDRFQSAIELAEAIDEVAGARVTGEVALHRNSEANRIVGNAPTMLDVSDAAELIAPRPRQSRRRGSFFGSLVLLAILLGGVGAAVWWVKVRNLGKKLATPSTARTDRGGTPAPAPDAKAKAKADPRPGARPGSDPGAAAGSASGVASGVASGSAIAGASAGSASAAAPVPAPAGTTGTGEPAGSAAAAGGGSTASAAGAPGSGASAGPAGGSAGAPPATGSAAPASGTASVGGPLPGPGSDVPAAPAAEGDDRIEHPEASDVGATSPTEIELDPTTAEDPAPASTKPKADEDEAANAPTSAAEVERRAPPAPVRTTTLEGAVQLIKEGKRDQALASLNALWKKTPASSYIPFLLGNLYYDQRWWSVAMDHYTAAIKKNTRYKANPTLNRNVIHMLGSTKTARRAEGFLKFTVGRPALPYVRYAAQHDPSAQIRRRATWLSRNL